MYGCGLLETFLRNTSVRPSFHNCSTFIKKKKLPKISSAGESFSTKDIRYTLKKTPLLTGFGKIQFVLNSGSFISISTLVFTVHYFLA